MSADMKSFDSKEVSSVGDISIPFISREDLINAKLAAGRPQDLVDAAALTKSKLK